MNSVRLLVLSFVIFSISLKAEEAQIYLAAAETEALTAKEGQIIVVYGHTENSDNSSGTNFVNFQGSEFFLVTFPSDLVQFPQGEPVDIYDDKRIAVEGVISVYRDRPQIKLTRPEQVRILDAGEVFPPVNEEKKETSEQKASIQIEEKPESTLQEEKRKRKPPVDASEFFR